MPKSRPVKKESLLHKTIKAVSSKPKILLYIFLLDLGFFAIFMLLNFLINIIIPADPAFMTMLEKNTLMFVGVMLLVILYFIIIIIAYSFFSLIILGKIKSLSMDHENDFSKFKRMFVLNLLLFAFFFVLVILYNIILGLLGSTTLWITVSVSIVLFIIGFMAYAFYNFTHSAFILEHELKDNLKYSVKHLFTKSYLGIFLFSFAVLIAYTLAYFAFSLLFKDFILSNYEEFINISSVITIVVVYVLFSFNRIYFFFVAERHIGHNR